MEAVGSVAAVLQLVQTVGKTVIHVSQVYHDVRDMDDTLRDFDSQLDATRMMLSVLSDGIQRKTPGPSTPPWWNQAALEGILNSYNRSYSRLGAIFVEIGRQRSSAAALRAYIRKRRYDGDISHLRLSIDTYTSALQLPVLIQTIQGNSTPATPQPPTGGAAASFDELLRRIDSLQSSMDRLDHDLVARALRRTDTPTPTSPQQQRSRGARVELDAVEQKEKLDMENDTRATLGVLKGLMGHAKDYASSIDSASTSSRPKQSSSKARRDYRDTVRAAKSRPDIVTSPDVGFGTRLPPTKRQDVSDWASNVDHGDNFSSASMDSSLPSVTATVQSAFSTSTKGTSLLGELHERRIQTAERFMKDKLFDKAIPHLERILSSSSDPEFCQSASQSTRSLAKALVYSSTDDSTVEGYCQKFPSIRTWVDEYRLKHGLCLLEEGKYDEVIVFLQSYKTIPAESPGRNITPPGDPRQSPEGHRLSPTQSTGSKTRQKIQIILCRALLRSLKSIDKDETIPILEHLSQCDSLDSADKGDALLLLAQVHHFKGNFDHAKAHGIKACQIKMDTLGRDHEETVACISLMVNICLDNNDPDEELWRGMLSDPMLPNIDVYALPPRFTEIQDRLLCCIEEMQRLAAESPEDAAEFGVKYLKENYFPISSQGMSESWLIGDRDWIPRKRECLSDFFFFDEPLLCWDCLSRHMASTHTLAGIEAGTACFMHESEHPSGFTGLSPFHFFSMVIPRPGRWGPRQGEDCVEEMDAILKIAKMTSPRSRITSRIINATMHYGSESKAVSALWLAATHENQAVVDFLLSLDETNAAQGITILQNTTYSPGHKREFKRQDPHNSPVAASQMRSRPFLKAFDALSPKQARRLLRLPGPGKWPWWFSCPFMLDKFLSKCGSGSEAIQAQGRQRDSASLLRLFAETVAIPSLNPYPLLLESRDIEKLFWALWEHGTKERNLRFMMQPISNTIDSAITSSSQQTRVAARDRLQLWFSILDQLLSKDVKFDDHCDRKLETCCKSLLSPRAGLGLNIGRLLGIRPTIPTYFLNARRAQGVSRARDAWFSRVRHARDAKDAKDAEDPGIERAEMADLVWNFLDSTLTPSRNTKYYTYEDESRRASLDEEDYYYRSRPRSSNVTIRERVRREDR